MHDDSNEAMTFHITFLLQVFNDPIHGHIELNPLCIKIIDTPQFQRLRYIKQLGSCYFVFPGASHNRFEHSLGVCYLAGELVRRLQLKQPNLHINEKDVLCVEIAGLCHDLGHGPFSHVFDNKFIPAVNKNEKWKHEDGSVSMFEHLLQENNLRSVFAEAELKEVDITFIKEQIAGPLQQHSSSSNNNIVKGVSSWPYKGRTKDKGFLYEVVANKRNGIDVDKWDYFARDCHHLGIKSVFDHNRFMKFARVLDVDNERQICSRDKEVGNLYDLFYTRTVLHRRAYQHKTTTIIDEMIVECLVLANDFIKIEGTDGKMLRMSEAIHDMTAYTKLNDNVIHQIIHSSDPNLKPAKAIFEMLMHRKLYKFAGQTKLGDYLPSEKVKEEIAGFSDGLMQPSDFVTQVICYDYGMKDDNPIDHVRFYLKSDKSQPIQFRKSQVSQMLPETFSERHLRVYCKKMDDDSLKIAKECFQKYCAAQNLHPPKDGSTELTPLKRGYLDETMDGLDNGIDTNKIVPPKMRKL